jgi:hypothetical protein
MGSIRSRGRAHIVSDCIEIASWGTKGTYASWLAQYKTVESIVAIPEAGCLHHRYERCAGRGLAAGENKTANDEYAATGMGRRTGRAVVQVWLDLEDAPMQTVNIRYEFHPQLVRLGILSPAPHGRSPAAS